MSDWIAVVDTNVWTSAFIFSSPVSVTRRVIQKAINKCVFATSRPIEVEITSTLLRKGGTKGELAARAYTNTMDGAIRTQHTGEIRLCRDPDDDKFLECAFRAKAHFLITGDADLLALNPFHTTEILSPADFLARPL